MAKGTRGGEATREGAGDDCDKQPWWVQKQTPEAPYLVCQLKVMTEKKKVCVPGATYFLIVSCSSKT